MRLHPQQTMLLRTKDSGCILCVPRRGVELKRKNDVVCVADLADKPSLSAEFAVLHVAARELDERLQEGLVVVVCYLCERNGREVKKGLFFFLAEVQIRELFLDSVKETRLKKPKRFYLSYYSLNTSMDQMSCVHNKHELFFALPLHWFISRLFTSSRHDRNHTVFIRPSSTDVMFHLFILNGCKDFIK